MNPLKTLSIALLVTMATGAFGQKMINAGEIQLPDEFVTSARAAFDEVVHGILSERAESAAVEFQAANPNAAPAQVQAVMVRYKNPANRYKAVLAAMSNHRTLIDYYKYDNSGQISYLVSNAAASNTNLKATHGFVKYRKITVGGYTVFYGISTSIHADFTVRTRSINLGGIFNLGAQANENKIFGTLSTEVIGIDGKAVTDNIDMPAELSESSIQTALQNFAIIKSKLYDPEIVVDPQIVAVSAEFVRAQQNIKFIQ